MSCDAAKFRRSGAEIGHLPPLCAGKQRITRASKGMRRRRRGRKRGWKSRDLSRPGGRVPFPPPEIRPLILVPHLPCAVSLKHKCPSPIRIEISTILYIFFYPFVKKRSFSKVLVFVGIIFDGKKFLERVLWKNFFFFFYVWNIFFSSRYGKNAKGIRRLVNEARYGDFIFIVYRWPTISC